MTERTREWEKKLAGEPVAGGGFSPELKSKIRERLRVKRAKPRVAMRIGAVAACLAAALAGILLREDIGRLAEGDARSAVVRAVTEDTLAAEGEVALKVLEPYDQSFMYHYGRAFTIAHPSVDLTVVRPVAPAGAPLSVDAYRAAIAEERPDVLRIPFAFYVELAREGLLQPLDTWLAADDDATAAMYRPVVDALRAAGDGQLYGLAKDFTSRAVFVNRELFEAHGIPLPEGAMTWEEVLQTAAMFRGKGLYGLVPEDQNAPFSLINEIGETEGLQPVSADRRQATIDTGAWREVWTDVMDGVREGWIFMREKDDKLGGSYTLQEANLRDPFMLGQGALKVASNYYLGYLAEGEQAPETTVDWIALPGPVDGERRSVSRTMQPGEVYAVAANSPNAEAAWELVKSIVGERMAIRDKERSGPGSLSVYRSAQLGLSPERRDAFYSLEADAEAMIREAERMNDLDYITGARSAFYGLGFELAEAVRAGGKTVPEALGELQAGVEQALASSAGEGRS